MNVLPKVVLFDDEEVNLKLYENQFNDTFVLKGIQNPHLYSDYLSDDISAILIDIFMPVMNGIELYGEILSHHKYNGCPIIFISSSSSDKVMLDALNVGGNDFFSKTMKKEEMITRINNKISSFKNYRHIYLMGNVKLNTLELKAFQNKDPLDLTLTEMKVMKFLMREYPKLSTRETINQEIWPGQNVIPTTLNTHLSNLRNKLTNWEYEIQFIKSKGVGLVPKHN